MERVVNEASIRPGMAGEVAIVGELVVEVAESAAGPAGEGLGFDARKGTGELPRESVGGLG